MPEGYESPCALSSRPALTSWQTSGANGKPTPVPLERERVQRDKGVAESFLVIEGVSSWKEHREVVIR
jgi:hypothetical protein